MKAKIFFAVSIPGLLLAYLFISVLNPPAPVQAAGFVVNANFDDFQAHDIAPGDGVCLDADGSCTLRAAIEESNALPGWDTITFSSIMTITIDASQGALPTITETLAIDASSVWDTVNDKPGIILNGNNQNISGLILQADSSKVYGLYIRNFNFYGLFVQSGYNIIGNTGVGERNVISGNGFSGIQISGNDAQNNRVYNNFIGVTPAGDVKEPNDPGILIANGASYNFIGDETVAKGNIIAGNAGHGVDIGGLGTNNNQLRSNIIGGSAALGNTKDGVVVHTNAGNTVIGGSGYGNTIVGNGDAGINLANTISGTTWSVANIIRENGSSGIAIWGASVQVISNTINNNTASGIDIQGATATGNLLTQNSIYSNTIQGINLSSGGNAELTAPTITVATATGASGTTCATCKVEIFSDAADEGKVYEGFTTADGSGNWSYSGALTGPNITATATNGSNNTSEFSMPKAFTVNTPPNTPANPLPADKATDVILNPTLSWSGGDTDGDTVTYIVYGGPSSWVTSTLLYSGTMTSFALTSLPANTAYTWQVAANDGNGGITQGPFWEFTTGSTGYRLFLPTILKP
jgi:hypothetical protein